MKNLYKQIFHDSDYFTNMLFDEVINSSNTLTIKNNEQILASLNLLDYKLQYQNNSYNAGYIYAVMTSPKFRRQGLMRQLINTAIEQSQNRHLDMLFLIEQEPYLTNIYAKFGFEKAFFSNQEKIFIHEEPTDNVRECTSEEAYEIYKQEKCNRIFLSQKQFDFEIRSTMAEGGRLYFDTHSKVFCLIKQVGNKLVAHSFINNKTSFQKIFCRAEHDFNCNTIIFNTFGNSIHQGMALILNEQLNINILKHVQLNMMMNK